jgi:hypothetical protein
MLKFNENNSTTWSEKKLFHSVTVLFSKMQYILHSTLEKVPSNTVCKAIQHFEVAVNNIRENLPQLNDNSEPSTKHA